MDPSPDRITRLIDKMKMSPLTEVSIEETQDYYTLLSEYEVQCIDVWIGELRRALSDRPQYRDILNQGWFAWMFAYNGLQVTMNPQGKRGPDLLIQRDKEVIYIEVKRFRPNEMTDELLLQDGPGGTLAEYGNWGEDSKKVFRRINDKHEQAEKFTDNGAYLVAVQSDDSAIDELTLTEAVQGGNEWAKISGALLYTGSIRSRTGEWCWLWENPHAEPSRRLSNNWKDLLSSLRLPTPRPKWQPSL